MIDFINRDHEEMHYALVNNGFTFESSSAWRDGGAIWDFVYRNGLECISFDKDNSYITAIVLHTNDEDFDYDNLLHLESFKVITSYFTNENTYLSIDSTLQYCGFTFEDSLNKWIYNLGSQDVELVDNEHLLVLTLSSGDGPELKVPKQIAGRAIAGFVTTFVSECKQFLKGK